MVYRTLYSDYIKWKTILAEKFGIIMAHLISHKMVDETALKYMKKSEEALKKKSIYILDKVLEEILYRKKTFQIKN